MNIQDIRKKFPQYKDMSDDALVDALHKKYYSDMPYPEFIMKMGLEKRDPSIGMTGLEKFTAGVATAPTDIWEGIKQLGTGTDISFVEKQRREAPLLQTPEGKAGRMAAWVPLIAGTGLIPGGGSILGSTLIGTGIGATMPVTGDVAQEKAKGAFIGGAFGLGTAAGLQGLSALAKTRAQKLAEQQAVNLPRDQAFGTARGEGYVIPPGMMGKTSIAEGMGGKAQTAQLASERNQQITNLAVIQDLDDLMRKIDPTKSLAGPTGKLEPGAVDDALDQATELAYSVYNKIKKSGKIVPDEAFKAKILDATVPYNVVGERMPSLANKNIANLVDDLVNKGSIDANVAIETTKRMRRHGRMNLKSGDPDKVDLGFFQIRASNAIEDLMERDLSRVLLIGKGTKITPSGVEKPHLKLARGATPKAVEEFRTARTILAKSRDVRDALYGGDVAAKVLTGKLKKGVPLSGKMKSVAQIGQQFPEALRVPRTSTPEYSPVDVGIATITATGQRPELAGTVLARPFARRLALSNFIQNRLMPNYQPGLLTRNAPLILEDPLTSAMTRGLLFGGYQE